jgi:tetratricopeptide (TPR) repeat protein
VQRYTRREVGRILGLDVKRLRYWERLRLVRPRARWGERFYSFGDLVALRTIQRLTRNHIPAMRVRRVIGLLEQELGSSAPPFQELHIVQYGREVLVVPPGIPQPFNPVKQQWALPFDVGARPAKLHTMMGQTSEELFQAALDYERHPEQLPEAAEMYRRVVELAPNWVEAHINLGVVLYQMGRAEEACTEFRSAVHLDPRSGISCYNLGCVLEEQGKVDEAIEHLRRAARTVPDHADVHFNLALAYEKRGDSRLARKEWMLYLRYAPHGPWAEQAREHMRRRSERRKRSPLIPFPRKA